MNSLPDMQQNCQTKDKEDTLKATKKKQQMIYKGKMTSLVTNFSTEITLEGVE